MEPRTAKQYTFDFYSEGARYWEQVRDGNKYGIELYMRHYSARQYKDKRERKLFVGPGEKLVLMTENKDALFVWRKFIDDSGQRGVNCAVFRNESNVLSSLLIKEAVKIALKKWPRQRLYTYVNAAKIKSSNPGCCFKAANWRRCGKTKGGLVILEYVAKEI